MCISVYSVVRGSTEMPVSSITGRLSRSIRFYTPAQGLTFFATGRLWVFYGSD